MARTAGLVGLATTAVSLVAAFLPTSDVTSVAVFESKLAAGVVGPTALGWFLFNGARLVRRSSSSVSERRRKASAGARRL